MCGEKKAKVIREREKKRGEKVLEKMKKEEGNLERGDKGNGI